MNWEQKLQAMQSLDTGVNPKMRDPGDWYTSVPGEIGGDGVLTSTYGDGTTPKKSVEAAWEIVVSVPKDRHLRIGGMDGRCVRWNGIMFADVEPPRRRTG